MRVLGWLVSLVAVAVLVALGAKFLAQGYVLIVAAPYRIELSLNFFIFATLLVWLFGYLATRLVMRTLALPSKVKEFRQKQREQRARVAMDSGLVAYLEGRYGKARQYAEQALDGGYAPGVNALIAARAALATHDFDTAEAYLARSEASAPSLLVSRLMVQAEACLDRQQPEEALRLLRQLRAEAGMHTAAQKLELRALQAARRWAEVPPLVKELQKRGVFDLQQAAQVRWNAQSEALRALQNDSNGLRDFWQRIPDADKLNHRVAAAAANAFNRLGGDREARQIIEKALEHEWHSGLLPIYLDAHGSDQLKQIEQAERWLANHPDDGALLLMLGQLCYRESLWGKAQSYLEASLAVDPTHSAHLTLGELYERQNQPEKASQQYVAALKLALQHLQVLSGGRRKLAL